MALTVKTELLSHGYALPSYQTEGAAGADLYAANHDVITLSPMQRFLVPTGIKIMLPPHYEAQIRPRSGLALKNGIIVPNSPGTVDADYRGEIKVILVNLGNLDFIIERGMRIAQMVIKPVLQADFIQIDQVDDNTNRGQAGFGSTGVNMAQDHKGN
ncbi:MAG: dUTP pyrophosphatase [Dasania sp.]|jgi:dUTP pyrophosphatase